MPRPSSARGWIFRQLDEDPSLARRPGYLAQQADCGRNWANTCVLDWQRERGRVEGSDGDDPRRQVVFERLDTGGTCETCPLRGPCDYLVKVLGLQMFCEDVTEEDMTAAECKGLGTILAESRRIAEEMLADE